MISADRPDLQARSSCQRIPPRSVNPVELEFATAARTRKDDERGWNVLALGPSPPAGPVVERPQAVRREQQAGGQLQRKRSRPMGLGSPLYSGRPTLEGGTACLRALRARCGLRSARGTSLAGLAEWAATEAGAGRTTSRTGGTFVAKVCGGGADVHPLGVQRGVQKWRFVKVTRRARNPVIVHPQFLPATRIWAGEC